MTTLRHNFDGGPDGTTITVANSGQVPGNDAFDGVYSSSCVLQYTNAFQRPTAEYVMNIDTSTAESPCVWWSTSMGTQSQIYMRMYGYFDSAPAITTSPAFFAIVGGSGAYGCCYMGLRLTTGKLYLANGSRSVFADVTAAAIPIQTWFRVEMRMQFSTTTGNADVRYYEDADTDDPTDTTSVSSWNTGASADQFVFGYPLKVASLTDMYISNIAISTADWLGPAPFKVKGVPGSLSSPVAIHNW